MPTSSTPSEETPPTASLFQILSNSDPALTTEEFWADLLLFIVVILIAITGH